MSAPNYKTGKDVRNIEIMQASIRGIRDGYPPQEVAILIKAGLTQVRQAYALLREAPDLAQRVLDGEITLYKAYQTVTKGEMIPCPTCSGRGHIFRKRR